jgi:hypothetical protein
VVIVAQPSQGPQSALEHPATGRKGGGGASEFGLVKNSYTHLANSHCATRSESSSRSPAIRSANPSGSVVRRSQLSMCCSRRRPTGFNRHHACGEISHVDLRCTHCGDPMRAVDVELLPGPGAAE